MPQIFGPLANVVARYSVPLLLLVLGVLVFGAVRFNWSSWYTRQSVFVKQPVPFSHEHHVSGMGIDCRYCHSTVETSSSAGMPSTHTCMTCHSQIWTEAPILEPIRASYREERPVRWYRVHDVPDYVYFDHSIHVSKGVGCETCHGRVDQMPLTYKAESLFMEWCLECHRQPERFIRPKEFVFQFGFELPRGRQRELGLQLVQDYHIDVDHLTDCSICHR